MKNRKIKKLKKKNDLDINITNSVKKKIQLEIRSENNSIMSGWEVSTFIDNFNSIFYKNKLLNDISNLISDGIDCENIFIFDRSFDVFKSYNTFNRANLRSNVISLYTFGLPYSFIPNNKIYHLKHIFEYFRACNEYLYIKEIERMDKNELSQLARMVFVDNKAIEYVFEEIRKYSKVKVSNCESIDERTVKKCHIELDQLNLEYLKNVQKFEHDSIMFESIKENIFADKVEELSDTQNDVYNNYFDKFMHFFNKVTRPVVCYYDSKTYEVKMLSGDYIGKNINNTEFFDLNHYSHNSPGLFRFLTDATTCGTTIYKTAKDEKRAAELHIIEIETKLLELDTARIENEKKQIEREILKEKLRREKIETASRIADLEIQLEVLGDNLDKTVDTIENQYIRSKVTKAYSANSTKMASVLDRSGLKVATAEYKPIIDRQG